MRILVIADTHDCLPVAVNRAAEKADEIWHLGDVCHHEILAPLISTKRPVHVVRGNHDRFGQWPETLKLNRRGRHFYLIHIPPHRGPEDCDVVLHGHTHVPRDEHRDGVRFLNPGSVGKANHGSPPSCAWLFIDRLGRIRWRLNPL